jgi:carboxypeptidase C (cathepsin A)
LRHELKYKCDLLYQGPFGGGYPPPDKPRGDWMSVKWDWKRNQRSAASSDPMDLPLYRAMVANPSLKVFMASGYYDLVCSYAGNAYLANHLEPELRQNVTARAYAGGHAIYTDESAQLEMKRDVAKFIHDTLTNTEQ